VKLDDPREVMRNDLSGQDAVGEVARDVALRAREGDLIDPLVAAASPWLPSSF